MKHQIVTKPIFVAAALVIGFSGNVFSETIQGEVKSVNNAQQTVQIAPSNGLQRAATLKVSDATEYSGVNSLRDLETGDTVRVEVGDSVSLDQTFIQNLKVVKRNSEKIVDEAKQEAKEIKAEAKQDAKELKEKTETQAELTKEKAENKANQMKVAADNNKKDVDDERADVNAIDLDERTAWNEKLSRGVVNFFTSPIEIPRTIDHVSNDQGAGRGWTIGLVQGLGRTLVRAGAGLLETVTFPFDFPNENKAPIVQPEYAWERWDSN